MSTTRKCRATRLLVTVGTADEFDLDACDGDCAWYTICEEHGAATGHRTRSLAVAHSAWPAWCEDCQPLLDERIESAERRIDEQVAELRPIWEAADEVTRRRVRNTLAEYDAGPMILAKLED